MFFVASLNLHSQDQNSSNTYIGLVPFRVVVRIRISTFLVKDSYKPSFATITIITVTGDTPGT